MFILSILVVFVLGNIIMTPFAYFQTVLIKFRKFMKARKLKEQIAGLIVLLIYVILGIPGLVLNVFADIYFFTVNNLRSNLKKIIIERKASTLTNKSIRNIKDYANKYINLKIKSVYTKEAVHSFRNDYNVINSIQFMMFGQYLSGVNTFMKFLDNAAAQHGGGANFSNLRRIKTQNLKQMQDQRKIQ